MKAKELKELSVADLQEKLEELTQKQGKLVLTNSVTKLENPLQIRLNRKDIARVRTEMRNRELNTK